MSGPFFWELQKKTLPLTPPKGGEEEEERAENCPIFLTPPLSPPPTSGYRSYIRCGQKICNNSPFFSSFDDAHLKTEVRED